MTNPIIKLVNAETGEEVEREMDAKELAQWEADKAEAKARAQAAADEVTTKAALLSRMGLTEDEARLLLG